MPDTETPNAIITGKHDREKSVTTSVNGAAETFQTGTPVELPEWYKEALETAGYTVSDYEAPKSSAKAEEAAGEGSPVASTPLDTEDRTEPHAGLEAATDAVVDVAAPGVTNEDGAPVLVGGDEPNPLDHTGATLASAAGQADPAPEQAAPAVKAATTAKPKAAAAKKPSAK